MITDLPKELGAIAKFSKQERDNYYAYTKCERVCSDIEAMTMTRVKWLQDELKFRRPRVKRWLDVGCHDGFVTRWMVDEPLFVELIGIDLSFDAISKAREAVASRVNAYKASYVTLDLEVLPPSCTNFDGINAFEIIEHITEEECRAFIRHLLELLNVNGYGYICTPDIDGPWGSANPDPHHINLYNKKRLAETLMICGAQDIQFLDICKKNPVEHIYVKFRR